MRLRFSFAVLVVAVSCLSLPSAGHAQDKSPAASSSNLSIPTSDDGLPGDGPIRRYDWFQQLWLAKRTQWSNEIQSKQGALVFLGDSITQGWGDDLHGVFGNTRIANRGISGDTTRGMLLRLKTDVLSLNPSGVVLLMGTNDLEEKAEPKTIADNAALIIEQIKAHNAKIPIVLCLVFPASESMKRPSDKIQEINRLYQAKVKGDPQVIVVDTWSLFADAKGDAKIDEFPDLLHPNEMGYKKWEAAIRPVLEVTKLIDAPKEDSTLEQGFEALFNGKDLTGWGFRPTSEEDRRGRESWQKSDPNAAAWPLVDAAKNFDGLTASDDGRYQAIHQRLVVTTPSEGRRIQQLWTTREFKTDFVLKLEFRATPNADSGIFVRGKQLQCRDYLLAGPYKELKQYKPQQWNEIEIDVKGNSARCLCNGEVLEEAFALPASGPIGLEGDRGQIEYRNICIKLTK
jgi:lysophospholipase L1-like esterase